MASAPDLRRLRVLVLHGFENHRPPGHWHRLLVESLRADGVPTVYPQLPAPDDPVLADWLDVLTTELELLGDDGSERVVVAHSLGCVLWWHACARGLVRTPVDRVLLVAPPGPQETAERIPRFVLDPWPTAEQVAAAGATRLVCSDADPWCSQGAVEAYATPLGLEADVIPGAGHLTIDDGYGPWPAPLAWVRDGSARLGR